jgi:hypothetical protein
MHESVVIRCANIKRLAENAVQEESRYETVSPLVNSVPPTERVEPTALLEEPVVDNTPQDDGMIFDLEPPAIFDGGTFSDGHGLRPWAVDL